MAEGGDMRLWKSLFYEDSTCEMKDDIPALIEAIKQDQGTVTRMQAMYLLWHHVLSDPARRLETIQADGPKTCLNVADDPATDNAHKSAALGLIQGMCKVTPEEDEEALNTIATTKSSGGRTCAQVMTQFLRGTETQAIAAASILRTLSGHEKAAGALGKEDTPFDRHFMDLFYFTKQDSVRGDIAFFLGNLMLRSEGIRQRVIAQGGVQHFLHLVVDAAKEAAVSAGARGLEIMSEVEGVAPIFVKAGALLPLLDVLGDPSDAPPLPDDFDMLTQEPSVQPKEPIGEVVKAEGVPFNPHSRASKEAKEREVEIQRATGRISAVTQELNAEASKASMGRPPLGPGAPGAAGPGPESGAGTSRKQLLGMQRSKKGWDALSSLPVVPDTAAPGSRQQSRAQLRSRVERRKPVGGYKHDLDALSAAAGSLWMMLEDDRSRDIASANHASFRLCNAMKFALSWTPPAAPGGKGKGGKAKGGGKKGKKGMQLLPEQEAALLRITGCLRHLSMLDTDKCRIARCDVAKMCDDLAMGAAKGPLRWNCRSLLGNVATMIENRSILENAGVMEEYLGLCSLSLTKEARSDLRTFFW